MTIIHGVYVCTMQQELKLCLKILKLYFTFHDLNGVSMAVCDKLCATKFTVTYIVS